MHFQKCFLDRMKFAFVCVCVRRSAACRRVCDLVSVGEMGFSSTLWLKGRAGEKMGKEAKDAIK